MTKKDISTEKKDSNKEKKDKIVKKSTYSKKKKIKKNYQLEDKELDVMLEQEKVKLLQLQVKN